MTTSSIKTAIRKKLAAAEKRLEKAEEEVRWAKIRVNALQESLEYRAVTTEYCQKHKLCTTVAECGQLHCAQKAERAYRSRDDKIFKKMGMLYVCIWHSCHIPLLPKDLMWTALDGTSLGETK